MITDPFDHAMGAPVSSQLAVTASSIDVESQMKSLYERQDAWPQTVDWDAVDAERWTLFP